jgi:hypothetical protein
MADDGPVVTDTGPLIGLAAVRCLPLLSHLYGSVLVPDAVAREVCSPGAVRLGAVELASADRVTRVRLDVPVERLLSEELGAGEAEAITLAVHRGARLLLMDDRRARRIAEMAYGLRVKGAAGVLVSAKRRGLLPAARPVLVEMRARGYYLSDRIIERACVEAEEA